MKLNRRGFISLGLGTTAGLTLSPLPYKLLDDISIWTQNWPWVPVPKDGKVSFVNSVCSLCPGGCSITVRKIDERVISVSNRKETINSKGGVCPLGLSGPQLLYTPTRVMSPMLQSNNGFQPVSWEKALSILLSRLRTLRDGGQQQKLAALVGTDLGTGPVLMKRFLGAFGSSGFFHMPSADDTWEAVTWKLTGHGFIPGYDLERAKTVLSFGCAIVEGWGSPLRSMHAHSLWQENGTNLIQVEPRLSNTAAVANRWIACRPGTEADLALGICRVLLEKYSACRDRLGAAVTTPEEFSSHLHHQYSFERIETTTGLTRSIIESLAVDFAASKHPLAICGKGEGRSPIESREVFATLMLNILVGSINRPGGLYCIERKSDTRLLASIPDTPETLFATAAETSDPAVELLLVAGANPCYSQSNTRKVIEMVQKIPFVVSFSSHWNETAMNSNMVLPIHSHLEGYRDFPVYSGLSQPKLGLSKPVSKRLFNSRYMGDVLIETAKGLGSSMTPFLPWKNYETYLKQSLGDRWQELTEKAVVDLPQTRVESIPKINPSDLYSPPILMTGSRQEYPLTLISKVSMRLNSGADASSPFMMKTVGESVLKKKHGFVDINPNTAEGLKLSEGDSVRLETPYGQADVLVHLDEGTAPGLVVMARGLGHGVADEYSGGKGTNFNELLGVVTDPLTGFNIAWGARAVVKKT